MLYTFIINCQFKLIYHMEVDPLPVIKKVHDLDHRLILTYSEALGYPIKPIRGRTGAKHSLGKDCCPRCRAPNQYLYLNSKKTGQRLYKVCKHMHIPGKDPKTALDPLPTL